MLCHVFSDLADTAEALAELAGWLQANLPPRVRIQQRGQRRQHIDLWGPALEVCGPPADRAALRRWLRPG